MLVLGIDTAADSCAACVWDSSNQIEVGRCAEPMRTGHAERLIGVIEQAMRGGGIRFLDLQKIAVSVGPGSFTGTRVGVSTARGLSLALRIAAVGVSTLDALSAQARTAQAGRPVLVGLGSIAASVSVAAYSPEGAVLRSPALVDYSDFEALAHGLAGPVLAGTAANGLTSKLPAGSFILGPTGATADISFFAQLGAQRQVGDKPTPLYLRAPDAKPQASAGLAGPT